MDALIQNSNDYLSPRQGPTCLLSVRSSEGRKGHCSLHSYHFHAGCNCLPMTQIVAFPQTCLRYNMAHQSATIKVLCRADALQDTANMLHWAIGHRVEVADAASDDKIGCLFIFTDVEYYENDTTLLDRLGFDIIGKIRGVVSWEVLPQGPAEK